LYVDADDAGSDSAKNEGWLGEEEVYASMGLEDE
jgi:hypothetical protein